MTQPPRRRTAQRSAILDALSERADFASAQDLHSRIRADGAKIGLATVYRALQDMATAGELDVLRSDSGELLYRQCAESRHHHHLVCRGCGCAVEVDFPGFENWVHTISAELGYTDIRHELTIFGCCASCSQTVKTPITTAVAD